MNKVILSTSIYIFFTSFVNGFIVASPPLALTITRGTSSLSSTASSASASIYSTFKPGSKFYQLEEMEDREACTTEVFLSHDGSVTLTETNGPPPISSYGTWLCNDNDSSFEMTIVRTYGTGNQGSDVGEFTFDVRRSFTGEMSLVGGLVSVSGSMIMKDDFFGDVDVGFFSMIDTTDARLGEED